MKADERRQMAQILSSVDENFLIALSNKGLVRRAQKDVEDAQLQIEETDECLIVRGQDWTVWMPPAGPAKARDDTKSSGITRQILMATIYLAKHWNQEGKTEPSVEAQITDASTSTGPIETEIKPAPTDTQDFAGHDLTGQDLAGQELEAALLQMTIETLSRWAGKKLVAEVMAIAQSGLDAVSESEIEIEHKVGLTLRLVREDIELRLLPTAAKGARLLDDILTTAPKSFHKQAVVLSIIALKKKHGQTLQDRSELLIVDASSPISRSEVLAETKKALENLLSIGIAHPSVRMLERLYTLSMSATAVHFPRIAYLLRALADEINHLVDRDADADTDRLLSTISLTHALIRALALAGETPPISLAGAARTQYTPVGDLQLAGIGCYPWRTQSGFEGLTVLFWENTKKRIFTWSTSRPSTATGTFDINQIYQGEAVWSGGGSPNVLSRSSFLLNSARSNASGRLSAGQQTSVSQSARITPSFSFDFGPRLQTNWASLRKFASSQFPLGLNASNPLDRIIVLKPRVWGRRFFDEMQQAFCWELDDEKMDRLLMTAGWTEINESAIEFMEALNPVRDRLTHVVARIAFTDSGFAVEPISFISANTPQGEIILNPCFDRKLIEVKQFDLFERLRKKFNHTPKHTQHTADDEWERMLGYSLAVQKAPQGIRNVLAETEALLLEVAESGTQRVRHDTLQRFQRLGTRSSQCGLTELAERLQSVSEDTSFPELILDCDYVLGVFGWGVQQSFSMSASLSA